MTDYDFNLQTRRTSRPSCRFPASTSALTSCSAVRKRISCPISMQRRWVRYSVGSLARHRANLLEELHWACEHDLPALQNWLMMKIWFDPSLALIGLARDRQLQLLDALSGT